MPAPAVGKIQFLDPDGLHFYSTVGSSNNIGLEYTGDWIVHLPAISTPPGDGFINEVDWTVEIPTIPGFYLGMWIGNDSDGDPSRFATDQIIDSRSLPGWVTYSGSISMTAADWFYPLSIITYDGVWDTFDAGEGFITVDTADSDPDWYYSSDVHVTAVLPTTAVVGNSIVVTGTGFYPSFNESVVGVTIGGVNATFSYLSTTDITVTIPSGVSVGSNQILLQTYNGQPAFGGGTGGAKAKSPIDILISLLPPKVVASVRRIGKLFRSTSTGTTAQISPVPPIVIEPIDALSGEGDSGTDVILTPVSGSPAEGDLLVAAVLFSFPGSGTNTMTPPAGWLLLQSLDPGPSYWLGYKFWHAGDPTSYTWTGNQPFVVVLEAFRGADEALAPSSGIRNADYEGTSFESIHFVEFLVDSHRTYLYVAAALTYGQSSGLTPRSPLVAGIERGTTAGGRFTALSPPHSDGLDALLAHRVGHPVIGEDGPYYIDGLETHIDVGAATLGSVSTPYVDGAGAWATSSDTITAPTGGDLGASSVRIRLDFDSPGLLFGHHVDLDSIGVIDQVTGLNLLAEDESTFETGISSYWADTSVVETQGTPTPSHEGTHSLHLQADPNSTGIEFRRDLPVVAGRDYLFTVSTLTDTGHHMTVRLTATFFGDSYSSIHQPENLDALFVSRNTRDPIAPGGVGFGSVTSRVAPPT